MPLYPDLPRDHSACGVGFLADLNGRARQDILSRALTALSRLVHRGAVDADGRTGDGAGVLLDLPRHFFAPIYEGLASRDLPPDTPLAVGLVFWPPDRPGVRHEGQALLRDLFEARGFAPPVFRTVPTRPEVLGRKALSTLPMMDHVIAPPTAELSDPECDILQVERALYGIRRRFEAALDGPYVASLSCRTLVYKGLMLADSLAEFFPDLEQPLLTSFAVFHQRFSTNTFPSWELAQPLRRLAHNGEINTIGGNLSALKARQADLSSPAWGDELPALLPITAGKDSDSAHLDRVVEFLHLSGRPLPAIMASLIPRAYHADPGIDDEVRAFYEYQECVCEPWDGPAALAFADGDLVGAHLDRNGLRPLRIQETADGLLCVASEVGLLDVPPEEIVASRRIGPGESVAVDLKRGEMLGHEEIEQRLARAHPYGRWLNAEQTRVHTGRCRTQGLTSRGHDWGERLSRWQLSFGMTRDEWKFLIEPMARLAKESVGSMGDDTPLTALSGIPRSVPSYFRQRFAQVTNPPIDPLREEAVMSLSVLLGGRANWLEEAGHAGKVRLDGPVLTDEDLDAVKASFDGRAGTLDLTFDATAEPGALRGRLEELGAEAAAAVIAGAQLLVLTDRGISRARAPVSTLLAIGAVDTHLVRRGLRHRVSLIVDSGEVRDVHGAASVVGLGADAFCPWLLFHSILEEEGCEAAALIEAMEKGLLKVMSKMGISTVDGYRGARTFEILGLSRDALDLCFPDVPAALPGIDLLTLEAQAREHHAAGFSNEDPPGRLAERGDFRFRRGGESHAWGPQVLGAMNRFRRGKEGAFAEFAAATRAEGALHLRDLLEIDPLGPERPVDDVEPPAAILSRFTTAAMSLGALSPEAHEALAIAMNRLGGRSNTGEGGEDPERIGTDREAKIKQVASGRFGVTPEYLKSADELEIKMAQGSKPGEGGQLPGEKVTAYIAGLRHASEGQTLISPPPHHDIYSIEDLAQLIRDLRGVNPTARITVKLVSSAGVGTIAAGVVKAGADVVLISGHDGGTGASPWSSIKNAGTPWELGLSEARQILVANDLRARVRLRVDGGLKTGRDVLIAALLGADEFNFGTAALVALGCRYVRQCHLDTCPVGIATQREDLRAKFQGDPEKLIAYFQAVAQETRELLAGMGATSLSSVVGRSDLLRQVRGPLDLSDLLDSPQPPLAHEELPPRPVSTTHAPQSYGAFASRGTTLVLEGDANDGVAKGLGGGRVILPQGPHPRPSHRAGNTCLYGATAGELFIAGAAGERFAVRNSGATAVVEGVGDHGCEYMTGGVVLILGPVGRNFAAGMTGGIAYVLDPLGRLRRLCNPGAVISPLSDRQAREVRDLLRRHNAWTRSPRAAALLRRWPAAVREFRAVTY